MADGEAGAVETGPAAAVERQPLASRMRPRSLDEVAGQAHLVGAQAPVRKLIETGRAFSVILWGPPGVGKTTLAGLMARSTGRRLVELSATTSGVKEIRAAIEEATTWLSRGEGTVLFVDEIHRYARGAAQDALLAASEKGVICLVGATTENPAVALIRPLLSRSLVLELRALSAEDVQQVVQRALESPMGLDEKVALTEEAMDALVRYAGGDARSALTALDVAAAAATEGVVDLELLSQVVERAMATYDKDGNAHYDVVSAYIKSLRGGDPDAAVFWLARMLDGGEDPRYIVRRLMVHASEDVGMADPSALQAAVAASHVVDKVGMPEARLALAQASIHIALAAKSNSVMVALGRADALVREGKGRIVPMHLRDAHSAVGRRQGHGKGYIYPHDVEGGVARQEYLPEDVAGHIFYEPKEAGVEKAARERMAWLRDRLGRHPRSG